MPNGICHCYQFDQPISVLRVVGGIFHFYSNLDRTICKQTVEFLIRHLNWIRSVCLRHTKIWVNHFHSDGCPHNIDAVSMDLYILYLKESQVYLFKFLLISVLEDCFYLSKQCRLW